MLSKLPPMNLELMLPLGKKSVEGRSQITVMDIMLGMTKNFHPQGLYSTEIFGKVGSEFRSRVFAYIDLNIPIFHPVYFKAICDLKELYGAVMAGKEYAVFDHQSQDFVKADPVTGSTGYKFFLEHFDNLKFEERDSPKRGFNIRLINKYRASPMLDKLPVMPAGLRDYIIDDNGKPTEDEINTLYRKIIGISNVISNISLANNEEYLNSMRYNLQIAVNQIYDYIVNLIDGKGKLIQGKWAARNIDNSTRNVITPYIQKAVPPTHPQFVSSDQHVVGLYQFLRAIFPKSMQLTRDDILSHVFPGPNTPALLTDKKTLKSVRTDIDPNLYDQWMTTDGLEKQFNRFKVKSLRHEPITIGQFYLGLIYNGPDNTYRFLSGLDELPEGFDPKYVKPISYVELFYLSVFQIAPSIPGVITRYPITGYGSIYPSYNYLKTTIAGRVMRELGDDWQPTGVVAPEYPTAGDYFYDSLSPASAHLGRLGGDKRN